MLLPRDPTARAQKLVLIDGDETRVLNVSVEKVVDTLDFFGKIQTESKIIRSPLLPFGCIKYASSTTVQQYVLSFPPTYITGKYFTDTVILNIAIPFTVLVINVQNKTVINSVSLYFSKTPVTTEETIMYAPALPNQYADLKCCMGRPFDPIAAGKDPLLPRLNQIFPYIQNSEFNEDLPTEGRLAISGMSTDSIRDHANFSTLPEHIKTVIRNPRDYGGNKVSVYCRAAWTLLNPSPRSVLELPYISVGPLQKYLLS